MTRICIVAHNAFASLTGQEGHIGGVELQTSILAKFLAEVGHEVSFVTWDADDSEIAEVDGVCIIRLCAQSAGLPVIRFFHPRWTSLSAALSEADADVYYHNGAEYVTGQVALYCKRHEKAFVFSAASDTDCDRALPKLVSLREKVLYRAGLKRADRVIVQTNKQSKSLFEGFSLSGIVLPMPCDFDVQPRVTVSDEFSKALWVGRIIPGKRLEWYLDVAEARPEMEFHVAGGADGNEKYASDVIARARAIHNVVYHGPLARDRLHRLYQSMDVFVCTSEREGFPNTFLEAWASGLPIISTFDPDDLIARNGLGYAVASVVEISSKLGLLRESANLAQKLHELCLQYFKSNHAASVALPRFESVICAAAREKSEAN